jgi:Flp pilus assembly protein TadG
MRRNEEGATILEAALVLSLLFLIVVGVIGFTVVFGNYQAITNAAREGARYAVAPASDADTLPSAATIAQKTCSFMPRSLAVSTCATYNGSKTPPTLAKCLMLGGPTPTVNDVYVTQCTVPQLNGLPSLTYTEVAVRESMKLPMIPAMTLHTTAAMRNENN